MLARDLKAATSSSAKPEKSWKREFALQQEAQALQEKKKRQDSAQPDSFMLNSPNAQPPSLSTPGFGGAAPVDVSGWFTEEDLGFSGTGLSFGQQQSPAGGLGGSGGGAGGSADFPSSYPSSSMDFSIPPQHPPYPPPASSSSSNIPPIPIPHSRAQTTPSLLSTSQLSASNSSFPSNIDQSTSPRQRRRLDTELSNQPPSSSSIDKARKQMAYTFNLPTAGATSSTSPLSAGGSGGGAMRLSGPVLPAGAIGHTGQSTYTLSSSNSNSGISPRPRSGTSTSTGGAQGGADENNSSRWAESVSPASGTGAAVATKNEEGPDSELADVIGQLSLNENEEVRYHGRSVSNLSSSNRESIPDLISIFRPEQIFWVIPHLEESKVPRFLLAVPLCGSLAEI